MLYKAPVRELNIIKRAPKHIKYNIIVFVEHTEKDDIRQSTKSTSE